MRTLTPVALVLLMASVESAQDGLVFSSDRDGSLQLYLLSLDDGAVRRLTRSERDERRPSVGPEGERIVYESAGGDGSDLFVLELESGRARRLTSTGRASEPAFSPDGRCIVFVSKQAGGSALHVMTADGTGSERLSPAEAWDASPAFSPDGARIALIALVDGDRELFVMDADGSARRRVTSRPGDESRPTWSPGGDWLLFGASNSASGKHDELVRIAPDGGRRRTLVGGGGLKREYMDRNVANWDGAVSPDGRRIAFCSLRDGNAELYLVHADGTGLRRLSNDPAQDLSPAWISLSTSQRREATGG